MNKTSLSRVKVATSCEYQASLLRGETIWKFKCYKWSVHVNPAISGGHHKFMDKMKWNHVVRQQNCSDTVINWGIYFGEQTNLDPPGPKVGFLQVVWTGAQQHCLEEVGEEKLHFSLLKKILSAKHKSCPWGQSISTSNLFANCTS